jgi:hypothetical protein
MKRLLSQLRSERFVGEFDPQHHSKYLVGDDHDGLMMPFGGKKKDAAGGDAVFIEDLPVILRQFASTSGTVSCSSSSSHLRWPAAAASSSASTARSLILQQHQNPPHHRHHPIRPPKRLKSSPSVL